MKRIALIVIVGLVLAAPASASPSPSPQQRPVLFLKGVVTALVANDYPTAWRSLHPAHQTVAPEAEYVACENLSPIGGRLRSLVMTRTRRKPVTVAGLEQPVPGVVVTFRLRLVDPSTGASVAFTLNTATVRVDGRWVWMLPRTRYELYENDACGAL